MKSRSLKVVLPARAGKKPRARPEVPAELRAALGRHKPPAAVVERLTKLIETNAGGPARRPGPPRRAERGAAERLGDVIESLSEGLAVYDSDDRLVLCNSPFRFFFPPHVRPIIKPGVRFEAIVRASVEEDLLKEGVRDFESWLRRRLEMRRSGGRGEMRLGNGRTVLVDERRTTDGGLVSTFTDITRLKRQEEEITRQSVLLQTTLEHLDQGISVFDRKLDLVMFNRRFVELLAYPDELAQPGTSFEALVRHKIARGEHGTGDPEEIVRARIAEARKFQPRVFEYVRINGIVLEVRDKPLPGGGGFVRSYTDVTPFRVAERRLATAKEEAEMASRTKSEFLANMSHELRTPLNAIIGFSDVMQSELLGPLGPRYRSYAKDIQESGEHLLGIINDILDLSKIEAGRLTLREEIVDPTLMVRECVRLLQGRAEEAGIALLLQIPPEAACHLNADAVKLKQILLNLVSNAVKFTPRGGRVEVRLRQGRGGRFEVVVEDTGIGMTEGEVAIALQPFRQVESTFARTQEGTGLGLPLTNALIELHGGTMTIESARGRGTTVTVSFPLERVWMAA
jgi:signal transduction histidine kinase